MLQTPVPVLSNLHAICTCAAVMVVHVHVTGPLFFGHEPIHVVVTAGNNSHQHRSQHHTQQCASCAEAADTEELEGPAAPAAAAAPQHLAGIHHSRILQPATELPLEDCCHRSTTDSKFCDIWGSRVAPHCSIHVVLLCAVQSCHFQAVLCKEIQLLMNECLAFAN
jgi:hypothetical protein